MVDIPEIKSSEKPEAQAINWAQTRLARNVDTPARDVEAGRPETFLLGGSRGSKAAARGLGLAGVWAVVFLFAAGVTSCVETAECNAAVTCPSGMVCYEYECRIACESQAQCPEEQVCAPCLTISGTHDQGKCFGADLNACVDGK